MAGQELPKPPLAPAPPPLPPTPLAPPPIPSTVTETQSLGTDHEVPDVNMTLTGEPPKDAPTFPISPANNMPLTTDGAVGESTTLPCGTNLMLPCFISGATDESATLPCGIILLRLNASDESSRFSCGIIKILFSLSN